jgi:hypothetical protein
MRAVLKSKDGMQAIIGINTIKDPAGGHYVPAKFIARKPGSDDVVIFDLKKVVKDTAYFEESDETVDDYNGMVGI